MQQQAPTSAETINALTATVDEAVALLRHGRYSDLNIHFSRLQQQAKQLESLKQALHDGAPAAPGLQARCEQLGRSLFIFSEVARQVATVEAGMVQLIAGPRGGSYDRDGQCETLSHVRFQQEA